MRYISWIFGFLCLAQDLKKDIDMSTPKDINLDAYQAALDASAIVLPEDPIILRVPAIPRCYHRQYKYDPIYGYCFKKKRDKDIEPLCKACASPNQVLKGSTCYGRRYSPKIASCNSQGNTRRNKEFVINEDRLCIRTEVYVPKSICLPGFKKKLIRNEYVCVMKDYFLPDLTCQTEVQQSNGIFTNLELNTERNRCVEYVYTNIVTVPSTQYSIFPQFVSLADGSQAQSFNSSMVKNLSCQEGYTLRVRNITENGLSVNEAYKPFDIDFATSNIVPMAQFTEFSCVGSILSSITPRPVCPNRSKYDTKTGMCKRKLASQKLATPGCRIGWFYNPAGQICQMAKVFKPYIVCPHGYEDWPGGTADTACASEKKEIADCECPAGTITSPPHPTYPNSAGKRKKKKCSHVDQQLPYFSCLHVPGYRLTEDRMCEFEILPSLIREKRYREKYRYWEYKIKRDERRARTRAAIGEALNRKYTRISIPQELIVKTTVPDYGPIYPCVWIANNNTLQIPKNPDGLPMACVNEIELVTKREQLERKEDQLYAIDTLFDANYLISPIWTSMDEASSRNLKIDTLSIDDDIPEVDELDEASFVHEELTNLKNEQDSAELVKKEIQDVLKKDKSVVTGNSIISLDERRFMLPIGSEEYVEVDLGELSNEEIASLVNLAKMVKLDTSNGEFSSNFLGLNNNHKDEYLKVNDKVLMGIQVNNDTIPLMILDPDEDESLISEFSVDMTTEMDFKENVPFQTVIEDSKEYGGSYSDTESVNAREEREIDDDTSTTIYQVKEGHVILFDDDELDTQGHDQSSWISTIFNGLS